MNGLLTRVMRYMFSRHTMIFYSYSISDLISSDWKSREGLIFRELSSLDYKALEALLAVQGTEEPVFQPPFDIAEAARRILMGGRCFICEDRKEIAGYAWFAMRESYIPEVQATIRLKYREIYAYNGYVRQKYRGERIIERLLVASARSLYDRGFHRCIIAGMKWNRTIHRVFSAMRFSRIGYLCTGYILTFPYAVNTCKGLTFIDRPRRLEFYRKLFLTFETAFSHRGMPGDVALSERKPWKK